MRTHRDQLETVYVMAANEQDEIYAEATRSRPARTIEHQRQKKTTEDTWNTETNAETLARRYYSTFDESVRTCDDVR